MPAPPRRAALRPLRALLPLLAPHPAAGDGGSTEIRDPAVAKARFAKKALRRVTCVGYITSAKDAKDFHAVAASLPSIPFYHVADPLALERLGLVGGRTVVALHRPWAPSKRFKVTYRGDISAPTFTDWVAAEAFPPLSYTPRDVAAAYDRAAERQGKAILRGFLATDVPDMADVQPDDWDQPRQIPESGTSEPPDWDDEDDGPWSAALVPNPAYQGEWRPRRLVTLTDDPEDEKPEDWDQPMMIPDPAAARPAGWNEEEDGQYSAETVPNPSYKGPWKRRRLPPAADVDRLRALLGLAAQKYAAQLLVTIQDASTSPEYRGTIDDTFGFNDSDYAEGRSLVIEQPKYSALKQQTIWLHHRFHSDGGGIGDAAEVEAWVGRWARGELVDIDKARRLAAKQARLEKEAAERRAANDAWRRGLEEDDSVSDDGYAAANL